MPTATSTYITFDAASERIDTDDYHDTGSDTDRITIPADGIYEVTGGTRLDTLNDNQDFRCFLRVNDAAVFARHATSNRRSGSVPAATVSSGPREFSAGEYIKLGVYHTYGSNRNAYATETFLTVRYLGPVPS